LCWKNHPDNDCEYRLYGAKIAFAVWLGFVTTAERPPSIREKLFGCTIDAGYQLVLSRDGAILAVWPPERIHHGDTGKTRTRKNQLAFLLCARFRRVKWFF
jgi:hypothetical protein